MLTNKSLHASVDKQEMIEELLVRPTVRLTKRTNRFSFVRIQMTQQMQPEVVVVLLLPIFESFEAEAARFHDRKR